MTMLPTPRSAPIRVFGMYSPRRSRRHRLAENSINSRSECSSLTTSFPRESATSTKIYNNQKGLSEQSNCDSNQPLPSNTLQLISDSFDLLYIAWLTTSLLH